MPGKIFIASSSAQIAPNAHTYLVYDEDGNTNTFNDQYLINAGPESGFPPYGRLNILYNELVQSVEPYKIDTDGDGDIDHDPEDYYNYTELDLSGASASSVWTVMTSYADALVDTFENSPVFYNPWGSNSNSVTNSILTYMNLDFKQNTPKENGVGDSFSINRYLGNRYLLDADQADTYNILGNRKIIFVDRKGNDTIRLHDDARIDILNDGNVSGGNTLDLVDRDRSDIRLVKEGDDLKILDFSGLVPQELARLRDHFDPEKGFGTTKITFSGTGTGSDWDLTGLDSNDLSNLAEIISDWLSIVGGLIESALNQASPLVLDLDGDGIELTSYSSSSTTYFDLNESGFVNQTGWVSGDDGLLALDFNSNGNIDSSAELFGSATVDGFTEFAVLDTNADGIISSLDELWSDLIVWQDLNSDGNMQADESHTMTDLDILSINLAATEVNTTQSGHTISHASTYTYDTGSGTATRDIKDVWFTHSSVNSRYVGEYELDVASLGLPQLRGAGLLPDLYIVASGDNTETGNLFGLVEDFSTLTFADLLTADSTVLDDVKDIMFRWAGVDGVSPTSRGSSVDARELEFLEKLMGQGFLQQGIYSNPRGDAGDDIEEAFQVAQDNVFARLATQGAGRDLFTGDFFYNIATDSFEGVTGLNVTTLNAIETEATGLANTAARKVFWDNVLKVVDGVIGIDNLSIGDEAAIDDAITDSDVTLDLAAMIAYSAYVGTGGGFYNGTSGSDTLTGGTGNDTLNGYDGTDTITGGAGNDYAVGGTGNDTYIYNLGHGDDAIYDTGGTADVISFGAGIASGDVTLTRVGSNDLLIEIDTGSQVGSIAVTGQFQNGQGIETLQFTGGGNITLSSVNFTHTGTSANQTLHGVQYGGGSADTIYAGGGNDSVYGYAGADTLYGEAGEDVLRGGDGNDAIDGGTGDDTLRGQLGEDSYYFDLGDGNDTIEEEDPSGVNEEDTLYFGAGIEEEDLSYVRVGSYDLKILVNGGQGGSILIDGQFQTGTTDGALETIILDDTTVIDLTAMSFGLYGTSSNETLHGNNSGVGSTRDIIYGEGGNDTIYGYLGEDDLHGGDGGDTLHGGHTSSTYYQETSVNRLWGDAGNDFLWGSYGVDYLYGGTGDDTMRGRSGNDHYYFNRAEGVDEIEEDQNSDTGDTLHFGDTIDAGDISYVRLTNDDLKILINGGSGGTITIIDQFGPSVSDGAIEYIQLFDNTTITLASLDYTMTGTSSGETMYGTLKSSAGNDTIYGLGGNDTIHGYGGNDTLHGGDGDDNLYGGANFGNHNTETSTNTLYGEAGADELFGSSGTDHMYGGTDNDEMSGHAGNDVYYFSVGDGDDTIAEYGTADTGDIIKLGAGIEETDITYLREGAYNLKILINGGADGSITLEDQFSVGGTFGSVELIELDDETQINLSAMSYTMIGTSSGEHLYGTLTASSGNDIIYGEGGIDVIQGYLGSDTLYGGDGNDTIHGGGSSSTYYNETSSNTLYGNAGNDALYGSNGADTLYGGDGTDTMTGRSGADIFVFEMASAFNNVDTVSDFSKVGGDALDLSDLLGAYDPMTHAITDFVQITTSGSNSSVFVDRDGLGGTYGMNQIATLSGATGLTDEAALVTSGNLIVV